MFGLCCCPGTGCLTVRASNWIQVEIQDTTCFPEGTYVLSLERWGQSSSPSNKADKSVRDTASFILNWEARLSSIDMALLFERHWYQVPNGTDRRNWIGLTITNTSTSPDTQASAKCYDDTGEWELTEQPLDADCEDMLTINDFLARVTITAIDNDHGLIFGLDPNSYTRAGLSISNDPNGCVTGLAFSAADYQSDFTFLDYVVEPIHGDYSATLTFDDDSAVASFDDIQGGFFLTEDHDFSFSWDDSSQTFILDGAANGGTTGAPCYIAPGPFTGDGRSAHLVSMTLHEGTGIDYGTYTP